MVSSNLPAYTSSAVLLQSFRLWCWYSSIEEGDRDRSLASFSPFSDRRKREFLFLLFLRQFAYFACTQ
jgi:hypothetical protein